ncbi:hypothetical protein GGR50DRAFT_150580 [Xylaria sp. CBS 124048]|nr:hypothetical protein GGR50DRAFT_150580 [Xylaria sp. CBS 124048]
MCMVSLYGISKKGGWRSITWVFFFFFSFFLLFSSLVPLYGRTVLKTVVIPRPPQKGGSRKTLAKRSTLLCSDSPSLKPAKLSQNSLAQGPSIVLGDKKKKKKKEKAQHTSPSRVALHCALLETWCCGSRADISGIIVYHVVPPPPPRCYGGGGGSDFGGTDFGRGLDLPCNVDNIKDSWQLRLWSNLLITEPPGYPVAMRRRPCVGGLGILRIV